MAEAAEIIFVPYNYLISPSIRKAVGINLEGSILIIDEAHNIESCATDSASIEISERRLLDALGSFAPLLENGPDKESYANLQHVLKVMCLWMANHTNDHFKIKEFHQKSNIYSGQEAVKQLQQLGINCETVPIIENALAAVSKAQVGSEDNDAPSLSSHLICLLSEISMVLQYITDDSIVSGFKMVHAKRTSDRQSNRFGDVDSALDSTLSFWCLNPAVVFRDMEKLTRSIILTSGTLSPLSSFSSELGVKFTHLLEAPHVIEDDQIIVAAIPCGPNEVPLIGTYKYFETYDYQDQLGLSLFLIATTIPDGVLVFLPSYSLLDKLTKRWKDTKLIDKLQDTKEVFFEPRSNFNGDFDNLLVNYNSCIQSGKGGMIFCVYRGKAKAN